MEDDEIVIFIETEEGKNFTLEVPCSIKYKDLKEKIKKLIIQKNNFYISYKSKKYDTNNENDILKLKQGDILFTVLTTIEEGRLNIKFHLNENLDEADNKTEKLSGILQICLLGYIAKKIENVENIKNDEVREIISELKQDMDLTDNPEEDIKENLSQKSGCNIITYKNYIKEKINDEEIQNLIELVGINKKKEINAYWSQSIIKI